VKAGAECLQIFESWAEGLSPALFQRLVIAPSLALLARLRALGVTAPVIGFPRGAGTNLGAYAGALHLQGLGLDTSVSPAYARALASPGVALQGNLDPMLLVAGGPALAAGVKEVLDGFAGAPHIFNLGHGITPEASPDHLSALVKMVKEAS
jgi:uroporphyrinogen decarboxylase